MTEPKKTRARRRNYLTTITHDQDGWQWNNTLLVSKIAPPDANGCCIWQGAQTRHGGLFGAKKNYHNQMTQAARLLWRSLHPGDSIEGYEIMHTCGNNLCLNPDHLTKSVHGLVYRRQGRRKDQK